MPRFSPALAALALLAGLPFAASAQDSGGQGLRDPVAGLDRVANPGAGCRLSETRVTIGTNRALTPGSSATQGIAGGKSRCKPLASTQIVAGVNLALAPDSTADQRIVSRAPKGSLATTNFARGVNRAGSHATAVQDILSQTGQ
jgi:hypothetical protein